MKNKHLVLLFSSILLIGLCIHGWPTHSMRPFEAKLLPFSYEDITFYQVTLPSQQSYSIQRNEQKWILTYENTDRVVTDSFVRRLFTPLIEIQSIVVLNTELPDSIGLGKNVHPVIEMHSAIQTETIEIGHTIQWKDQPATWIRINKHREVYLVPIDLPRLLYKVIPTELYTIPLPAFSSNRYYAILGKYDTLLLSNWPGSFKAISNDSLQNWYHLLYDIRFLPRDHDMDETNTALWKAAMQVTGTTPAETFRLDFSYIDRPENTDNPSVWDKNQTFKAHFVLNHSNKPGLLFAIYDTALVRKILWGRSTPSQKDTVKME